MTQESYQKIVAAINADNTGQALTELLAKEQELDLNSTVTLVNTRGDHRFEVTLTPLSYLVSKPRKFAHLQILLNAGVNVKYKSPEGNTALYFALRDYHCDTTKYCQALLDAGASRSEVGTTMINNLSQASAEQVISFFHREFVPGKGILTTPTGQALHVFMELYQPPRDIPLPANNKF